MSVLPMKQHDTDHLRERTELRCTGAESGQKLLKHLLRTTDGTKIYLYKLFRKGDIKVNGRAVDQAYVLQDGDTVSFSRLRVGTRAKHKFQGISRDLSVLHEDDLVIAVDKDESTIVHAAGSDYQNSLLEKVKAHLYRKGRPHGEVCPVHRIDRNTRGVVLFAKNNEAAKKVNALFKSGEVEKTYQALLEGKIYKPGFVEADIIRSEDKNSVQVRNLRSSTLIPDKKQWLESKYRHSTTLSGTVIRPIGYIDDNRFTITEITIWTGRHHQIRAIAKAIGCPMAGDKKYFASGRDRDGEKTGQELICKRIVIEKLGLCIESRYSIIGSFPR
jgi:23S rRNA pseudouridine955/2504/2580 synthase